MPNIAQVLKDEISRLSKKVVNQQIGPMRSAAAAQRKQFAALRKQVQQLQRDLAVLRRSPATGKAAPGQVAEGARLRLTAKGIRSLRGRLALSAENFGRLLNVGAQTVYNWEGNKTSPRASQFPAIAELRKIGKREATRRLNGAGD